MTALRVLSVASEVFPLVKTGGLADVAGALPGALAPLGVAMRTLVPGYPSVIQALERSERVADFAGLHGGPAHLLEARAAGLDLLVLDAPNLFARPGNPYVAPNGVDWPDNAYRFGALGKVAADLGRGLWPGFVPDVVHAHDWQAALTPAFLHYAGGPRPATVLTVHNLAFQGQFPAELLLPLGLPPQAWSVDGVEYYGTLGFLKAGLQFADRITTVSPTYALEIRGPAQGMGLDGLLRARGTAVSGILNGIDTAVWDPASDPHLEANFDLRRLRNRPRNKAALQRRLGLAEDPQALLFGVISRLSWQKGLDLLPPALPGLFRAGAQLVLLGAGDAAIEAALAGVTSAHRGSAGCVFGYDEDLAHQIQAGADAILVPSRFEPCGLTQLCALRYGAVPVVARVGGLADTVIDASPMALAAGAASGVQFAPVTGEALDAALHRTLDLWRNAAGWGTMQKNGMRTDVSWTRPAAAYAELYRDAVAVRG
jgi:starch synthase